MLRSVCPRCRQGAIFKGKLLQSWLNMYEQCPVCGLRYEREQGYFLGAMIFSYILSVPVLVVLMLAVWLIWRDWSLQRIVVAGFVAFLPFVPGMVRFSRVLWIHFDRAVDPD
ncbi:MAG TPA: DUF983 domain-containing protein [Bryobacterales bacterium]|nr:DUF983 domain-containing protein [Bryobacterales bacterium]